METLTNRPRTTSEFVARQLRARILSGDLPDPLAPPSGCAFRTRCFRAEARCAREPPALAPFGAPGHLSACHFSGAPTPFESDR